MDGGIFTTDHAQERSDISLKVTFEGVDAERGISVEDLGKTLSRVQQAVRLMVNHLHGNDTKQGLRSHLIRGQSNLRIISISKGSVAAELELAQPADSSDDVPNYGPQAIEQIVGHANCTEGPLPSAVLEELQKIGNDLSESINGVRICGPQHDHSMSIQRHRKEPAHESSSTEILDTILHGALTEVDWHTRTAQLRRWGDERYLLLHFPAELEDDMKRLANQYVKLYGRGTLNQEDQWVRIDIERIEATRSAFEPWDYEAFKNRKRRPFDPSKVVVASEPFDVDQFIKDIHDARDVTCDRGGLFD